MSDTTEKVIADLRKYVVWSETTEFPSLHALRPSDAISLLAEIDRLTEEVARLREALTPSAATKSAYNGEFGFAVQQWGEGGEELPNIIVDVPWTTVKQIMAEILARAAHPASKP